MQVHFGWIICENVLQDLDLCSWQHSPNVKTNIEVTWPKLQGKTIQCCYRKKIGTCNTGNVPSLELYLMGNWCLGRFILKIASFMRCYIQQKLQEIVSSHTLPHGLWVRQIRFISLWILYPESSSDFTEGLCHLEPAYKWMLHWG